jgi:hypothetical protein
MSEGEFEIYTYPISDPENLTLAYKDHNQIQFLGANVIARLLCLGQYGKTPPVFTNIKASVYQDRIGTEVKSIPIGQQINLFPGEPFYLNTVVEADTFASTINTKLYQRQYVKNIGTFESVPPKMIVDSDSGTYYHFGLFMSAFTDIEEYLFAYKFIDNGFTYPDGFGLKIHWTIYIAE